MALNKPVVVGEKVKDSKGDVWTITRVAGQLAYYDKPTRDNFNDSQSKIVDSVFIAIFDTNSRGLLTYNKNMTLVEEPVQKMCKGCGKNPKASLHSCPYRSDIMEDSVTLCSCCSDCKYECAMDI